MYCLNPSNPFQTYNMYISTDDRSFERLIQTRLISYLIAKIDFNPGSV